MKSVMRVLLLLIINLLLFIRPGEVIAKIFDRCELARVLHYQHYISVEHVAVWVCIAQHQSGFNTSALLHHADGGYHGMYQISDVFWCSPWAAGNECNIDCARLRDEHLYDDFVCMSKIYNEHQKISGDGYNAWTVYKQYCNYGKSEQYVSDCFGSNDLVPQSNMIGNYEAYQSVNYYARTEAYSNAVVRTEIGYKKKTGKVYERCELARELLYRHQMAMDEIANWVCIAYHESNFNTSAVGRKNTDGSGDHGLFQISDIYWCSPPGKGRACGLSCAQLEDDDISDDVACMKKIYDEHTRISGDGFTAWSVYQPYCLGQSSPFTEGCFTESDQNEIYKNYVATSAVTQSYYTETKTYKKIKPTGKRYDRCELARELKFVHNFPDDQIATWVCIVQHESNFNVSAIGRLNADGSGDHGLFQISDIYWCSPPGKGWACGLTCSELEDNDISDDVACVKQIYEEHTKISGDGFNAWTVYPRYCKERSYKYIDGCFEEGVLNTYKPTTYNPVTKPFTKPAKPGKVYERCELARELKYVHNVPDDQIALWVCLAQHESSYNTSAVGIGTHGLFQISDEYWCSPPGKGVACRLTCAELEDGDISNDLECVRKIHEEHTRISGNGFNAWAVYSRYCKERAYKYVDNCFETGVLNTYKPPSSTTYFSKPAKPAKVYERCELARELKYVYNIPDVQIATWVCIAQHGSSYNTSAAGIGTHGLFQVSDEYWCSPPGKGWACGLTCAELKDGDISNDLECVRNIYDEHTRLSGDGFNAWTVYPRYCKDRVYTYLDGCFENDIYSTYKPTSNYFTRPIIKVKKPGKIYDRCELARELKYVYKFPDEQIPTWVCIVEHESSYNTSAVGRLNVDGSGDHGLFQLSDIYWCSESGTGNACGLTCAALEDDNIADDVECVRRIHEEHTRLSGDGFNAWTVYPRYCKDRSQKYADGCFADGELQTYVPTTYAPVTKPISKISKPGKIYDRCELAYELKYVHNFPDDQIATWVCIVQHESNFNTSVVGRHNGDGSGDHGLFQISDIYWCSPPNKGWACGLTCSELEDGDITDDVECVRKIYEEHRKISGDGFNAWTVYPRYCDNGRAVPYIDGCFDANTINTYSTSSYFISTNAVSTQTKTTKIYDRCELARELKYVHNLPDDQLAVWVCIAQHESNFNTSAVGRLNRDGSGDHGLFQISDIYWCSPPGKGYACGLTCAQLEDNDIRDDMECARKIYEEHNRISGDGFNAWTVYALYCKGQADQYIADCFTGSTYQTQQQSYFTSSYQNQQVTSTSAVQQSYPVNTFYGGTDNNIISTTPSTFASTQYSSFNQYNTKTTSTLAKTTLQNNAFFNGFFPSITQKPITKAPLTTHTNQYFTVPQTYQPISKYTTKPGFYNYYTQQASTKNIVTKKPDDMLAPTTPKPITIKKSTTSSPKTKSTSIKTTTKPFVLPSTTPKSTLSTTTRKSTTKFTFPPFTTRSTTPNPFLTHHFFTIPTKKPISITTAKMARTSSTTKTTTPRTTSTTKTTTIKPRTTTRSSIFDRFPTISLKPTTNPFKYFTTPRPTVKSTSTPFRFPFPVTNKKPTTKSIFNTFTTQKPTTKSPRTTRITTTSPRTTTRFDFDAFFSRKPSSTTPSPRTIRATVPLVTPARITPWSTTQTTTPRSTSSRSTPRPFTSTLRSPFEITTGKSSSQRITSPTRPPAPYTTSKPITTTTKSKTTSSITLSRSTFSNNNNNLNINKKPKIETTTAAAAAATPSLKTTKASPFDLWFDRLKHL